MIFWCILSVIFMLASFALLGWVLYNRKHKCKREGCKCKHAPHNDACEQCQCCMASASFDDEVTND